MAGREIKVDYDNLEQAINDLESIAAALSSRSLTVTFSQSKGAAVEAYLEAAKMLKSYGLACGEFIQACADGLRKGESAFKLADDTAGDQFNG